MQVIFNGKDATKNDTIKSMTIATAIMFFYDRITYLLTH
jgi:hypothetical protein